MGDDLATILAQLSEIPSQSKSLSENGHDTSLDTAPFGSAEDALKYIMGEQHHLGDLSKSFKTMTNESDIASVRQAVEGCNYYRKLVDRASAEFQAENLVPWFRLLLEKFLVAKEYTQILGWHFVSRCSHDLRLSYTSGRLQVNNPSPKSLAEVQLEGRQGPAVTGRISSR